MSEESTESQPSPTAPGGEEDSAPTEDAPKIEEFDSYFERSRRGAEKGE
jgi:hypothetical protein